MAPGKKPIHVLPWIQSQSKIPDSGVRLYEDDTRSGFVIFDKKEVGRRYSVLRQGKASDTVETYLWFERLDSCVQKHGLKRLGKKTEDEVTYYLPKEGDLIFTSDLIITPPTKEHRRKRRLELAAKRKMEKEVKRVAHVAAVLSHNLSPQPSTDPDQEKSFMAKSRHMVTSMNPQIAGYRPPDGSGVYWDHDMSGAGVGSGVGEGQLALGLGTAMETVLGNPNDKDLLMALIETCVGMLTANERVEILRNVVKGIPVRELSMSENVSNALESISVFLGRARTSLVESAIEETIEEKNLEQHVDALLAQLDQKSKELESLRAIVADSGTSAAQRDQSIGHIQALSNLLSPTVSSSKKTTSQKNATAVVGQAGMMGSLVQWPSYTGFTEGRATPPLPHNFQPPQSFPPPPPPGDSTTTLFSPTASSDVQFGSRMLRGMSNGGDEAFFRQDSAVYPRGEDESLDTYGSISGVGKARI